MGEWAYFRILDDDETRELLAAPDSVQAFIDQMFESERAPESLDLEKAWDALHFVLSGSLEPNGTPLSDAVLGGVPMGPDVDYGPARFLSADKVKEIYVALCEVDFREKYLRINRASPDINRLYRSCFVRSDDVDVGLELYFEKLKSMYGEAARMSKAVLSFHG